jgi:transcriptional regulator with GAF, ATPase, and Fis domain
LGPDDFQTEAAPGRTPGIDPDLEDLPLAEALDEFKARLIRRALSIAQGNQTAAAKRLGLRQPNLSRMMRTLGISLKD